MGSRRRGDVLETAILEAAWTELERGWPQFGIESVAVRAGTGKAAIYRRWPDRVALARAAAEHQADRIERLWEPTSDLRADLLAFSRMVAAAYAGPLGQAVRGIVAATRAGDAVPDGVVLSGGRVVAAILAAARLQPVGEPASVALVLNLGISVIGHRTLVTGRAPGEEALVALVDDVWLPALERILEPIL